MPIIEVVTPGVAAITQLASKVGAERLGRTSLMKLLYFLQEVREVPLGYHFTLYSYGPFDSDVLSDLGTAEALQAVETEVVPFSGGYRYKIDAGPSAEFILKQKNEFLHRYSRDFDWVVDRFAAENPATLELLSTIVYADREEGAQADRSLEVLADRVHRVKPKFSEETIRTKIQLLKDMAIVLRD
ncbi:hypothetical protein WDZ92_24875 [Nostoc sp. NIES-2111]